MTQEQLRKRRPIVMADLLMKAEVEDWHGVADAAMDLREIDAGLTVYDAIEEAAEASLRPNSVIPN